MINEDSIDESVGAHPTYVHFSDLEKVTKERDLWQETAEAYKFDNQKLRNELNEVSKANIKAAYVELLEKRIRELTDLCLLFEQHYVCEECSKKGGTYLLGCSNPLHKIHDLIYNPGIPG